MAETSGTKDLGLGVLFEAKIAGFAGQLTEVKNALIKMAGEIDALGKKGAELGKKLEDSQKKVAAATQKTGAQTKQAADKTKEGINAIVKSTENLATATGIANEAAKVHNLSLADVKEQFKGLDAANLSMIAKSKMSTEVMDGLSKKLVEAKGAGLAYRNGLIQAGVEAGTNKIRFEDLTNTLKRNEKGLLQTATTFGKVRGQLGAGTIPKDLNGWIDGVDRLKLAHASLNKELFKSDGVILNTQSSFLSFQRQLKSLQKEYGTEAYATIKDQLGTYIKTLPEAKKRLEEFRQTQLAVTGGVKAAGAAIQSYATAMNQLGLKGKDFAASANQNAAAMAFTRGEVIKTGGVLMEFGKKYGDTQLKLATSGEKFRQSLSPEHFANLQSKVGAGINSWIQYETALKKATERAVSGKKINSDLGEIYKQNAKAINGVYQEMGKNDKVVIRGALTIEQMNRVLKTYNTNQKLAEVTTGNIAEQNAILSSSYREVVKGVGQFSDKARAALATLDGSKHQAKLVGQDLVRLQTSFLALEKATSAFNKAITNLGSQTPTTRAYIDQLKQSVASGSMDHAAATKAVTAHGRELALLAKQANTTTGFWANLSGKIQGGASSARGATDYMSRLGQAIGSLTAWIPAALIVGSLTSAIGKAVNAVIVFDQTLKSLQAISSSTNAEMSLLGDEILRISETTKFSAAEIGKGAIFIAQAGFTAGESLQVMGAAALGAQGTLEPLAVASDLLTTVIRAFNLDASNAAGVMDMLAVAANKSKTNLEGMKTAFNYIGPVAHSAKLGIDETLAALMMLSNVGMRMSTIGTSLRQIFINLESPNKNLRAAIRANGLSIDDFNLKSKGLVTVLENLDKVIKGSGSRAKDYFNVRAGNAALVLSQMNKQVALMLQYTHEYGSASTMAGTQVEGLGMKLSILGNKFENLFIKLGRGGITEVLKLILDGVTKVADAFTYLVENPLARTIAGLLALSYSLRIVWSLLTKLVSVGLASWLGTSVAGLIKMAGAGTLMELVWLKIATAVGTAGIASGTTAVVVAQLASGATAAAAGATLWQKALLLVNYALYAISSHPIVAFSLAIAGLAMYMYNVTQRSKEYSEELQKSAIKYNESASAAKNYSDQLVAIQKLKAGGKDTTGNELVVLKGIGKDFPEVIADMLLYQGNLTKQIEIIKKVEEERKKLGFDKTVEVTKDLSNKTSILYTRMMNLRYALAEQRTWWTQLKVTISDFFSMFDPRNMIKMEGELSGLEKLVLNLKLLFSGSKEGIGRGLSKEIEGVKGETYKDLEKEAKAISAIDEKSVEMRKSQIEAFAPGIPLLQERLKLLVQQYDLEKNTTKEQEKQYGVDLVDSQNELEYARIKFQKEATLAQVQLQTHLLENSFKLGLTSETDYYAKKRKKVEDSYKLELGIIENAWGEVDAKFERRIFEAPEGVQKNKLEVDRLKAAEDKKAKIKIAGFKQEEQLSALSTEVFLNDFKTRQDAIEFLYNFFETYRQIDVANEKASIEEKQTANEWLYSQNLKSYSDYVHDKALLLETNSENEVKAIQAAFDAYQKKTQEKIDDKNTPQVTKDQLAIDLGLAAAKLDEDLAKNKIDRWKGVNQILNDDEAHFYARKIAVANQYYQKLQELLRQDEAASVSEIERKTTDNDYLYSQRERTAANFYQTKNELATASMELEKKTLRDAKKAYDDNFVDRTWWMNEDNDTYKNLLAEKELNTSIFYGNMTEVDRKYWEIVLQNMRDAENDWEYVYSKRGILGVVSKSLDDISKEYAKYGERWNTLVKDSATAMSTSFENGFFDIMQGQFTSLGDYFNSFLNGMQRSLAKFMADEVTNAFLKLARVGISAAVNYFLPSTSTGSTGNYMTSIEMHKGGKVGQTASPTYKVPSSMFDFAPRLHKGLRADEFPAILQKGETVTPRGQEQSTTPNVSIIVNNESGQNVNLAKKDVSFNMQEMVVTLWIDAAQTNKYGLRNMLGA